MDENNGIQYTDEEKIRALVDRLNAYIEQYHGGSVEIVSFENRVLKSSSWRRLPGMSSFAQHFTGLGGRHNTPIFPGCHCYGISCLIAFC